MMPSTFHILGQTRPEYPPLVKLKIGVGNTGDPTAKFHDQNRELTTINHIAKGDMVKVIADLGNIWFMNGKLGATSYVHQVQTSKARDFRRLRTRLARAHQTSSCEW